ncbi:aggregation-promoting factor C-terminal-like domain-containing protein [Frondihabitans cladoniiphilus]|uniref:Septal ring factor EnvC (AmiA/AmiB activator) n=1 Tax=Frondihabitans cladoniiphilus TaxID=715785 RepID=A0ABP8VQN4_9MICO
MSSAEHRPRASRVHAFGPASRQRSRGLAFASGAAVVAVAVGILCSPLSASAYPSWSDVQAAQGNAAATQVQVQAITSALSSLQNTAATSSQAAITAEQANDTAQQQYETASSAADALQAKVAAEQKQADQAQQQAGQLAANLYRLGNSQSLDGQLFSGKDTGSTLYRLGALSQLTAQWHTVLAQATVASKSVASLSAQAQVAADERDRLAGVAKTTLAAAKNAQAAADAEVTDAQTHQATLYAQLASLNNTTAQLEQQYQQGQAAAAAYAAAQAEKAKEAKQAADAAALAAKTKPVTSGTGTSGTGTSGASSGSGGSGSGTGTSTGTTAPASGGGTTNLGSGVVNDTAGAHAYAQAQLASRGWSGDYQCLVNLWNQESGWRTNALNVSSGAYGIPQALPAKKMATAGLDWQTSYATQINWGLGYIAAAYGTPCGAWAHEVAHNWY